MALRTLGFTQVSWDNLSGQELQPWSSIKSWSQLTGEEKKAAEVLGYNQKAWDNDSGSEPQPASGDKSWAEMTSCTNGQNVFILHPPPAHPSSL